MGNIRAKRRHGVHCATPKRGVWDHSTDVSYVLALARQVHFGGKSSKDFVKASWNNLSKAMHLA